MSTDKQIDEAKARVAEAERSLEGAERQLVAARAALFALQCDKEGIHIGDRVRSTIPGDKTEAIVSMIDMKVQPVPYVHGRVVRKDGTAGVRHKCLFNHWRVVRDDAEFPGGVVK